MSWTRIILALVVLALSAGGYYYFDVVKAREHEAAEEAGKKVIAFSPDEVVALSLDRPGKEKLTIEKKDGAWRITRPVAAMADEAVVTTAVKSLQELDREGEIEQAPSLDEFGLKEPVTVTLTLAGGEERALKLGGETPMGGKYYALAPDGSKVIMVGAGAGNILKSLYDYRDKKLLNFASGAVAGVVIRKGGKTMSVEKTGSDEKQAWRLTGPVDAAADSRRISGLIDTLVSARASGFVDEDPDGLEKYGLDRPEAMVELSDEKGNRLGALLLGGRTDGGNHMAKLEGAPAVFRAPGEIMDELPDDADGLRDRAFVKVNREDVNVISIDGAEGEIRLRVVERGSAEESSVTAEREWVMTAPVEGPADSSAVAGFLFDVESAKVKEFIADGAYKPADYGLDKPALRVTLSTGEGEREIALGASDGANGDRYATAGKGYGVVTLDRKTCESLNPPVIKLRDTRFFKVKSEQVGRVVVDRNGQVFDARTFDGGRVLMAPEERELEQMAWNGLVWTVIDLRFKNEYEKNSVDPLVTGLDRPAIRVSVYNTGGALIDEVLIGAKAEDGKSYYVKSANHDEIFNIDESFVTERIVNALEKLVADQG